MMLLAVAFSASSTTKFTTVTAMALTLPNLDDLASRIYDTKLKYRVAFGNKDSPFTMNGLHVQLDSHCQTPKQSSTGIHTLSLLSKPWYINDKGEQLVQLDNGGWEISWNTKIRDSKHGLLICSFVSPETYTRTSRDSSGDDENNNESDNNEISKLQQGRFFISHRVWTKETLELERDRRRKIQNEAAQYLNIRDTKVKEIMDSDNKNVGSKILSYAQATQAKNSYFTSGYAQALYIPLYDDQVLQLQEDCIVSTRGEIFQYVGNDGSNTIVGTSKRPRKVGLSRVDFLKE